jgi:hypothetical protein
MSNDRHHDHHDAAATRLRELTRRLCAAAISYRIGYRGVDHALPTLVGAEPVGACWLRLAREVSADVDAGRHRSPAGGLLAAPASRRRSLA